MEETNNSIERLDKSIEEIKTFAEKENISLVKGASIYSEKGNAVSFFYLQNFLDFLKTVGIKVLFVKKTSYNEAKFNHVVKDLEDEDIEELKKEYSCYFEKIDSVSAFCIYQDTLFSFDQFADWTRELKRKVEEDYEESEDDDNENEEEDEKNPKFEELKEKTLEEIKEEIKEKINYEEIYSSYGIREFLDNYLLEFDIVDYYELRNKDKELHKKFEKIRMELERDFKTFEIERKKGIKEKIDQLKKLKDKIIPDLVVWAKDKGIQHNILSQKSVMDFLVEKNYVPEELSNIIRSEIHYFWLEAKNQLKKNK